MPGQSFLPPRTRFETTAAEAQTEKLSQAAASLPQASFVRALVQLEPSALVETITQSLERCDLEGKRVDDLQLLTVDTKAIRLREISEMKGVSLVQIDKVLKWP